jgi:hypothetical protein
MKTIVNIIVLCAAILFCWWLHGKRFIFDFVEGEEDVLVTYDGEREPVSVFRDSEKTEFGWATNSTPRRLLVVFPEERYPRVVAVSSFGVATVGLGPYERIVIGGKVLLCLPHMNVAYDIRDDMKSIAATVNVERGIEHVKYHITWDDENVSHEIMLRISSRLQKWLEGDAYGCLTLRKHCGRNLGIAIMNITKRCLPRLRIMESFIAFPATKTCCWQWVKPFPAIVFR